MTEDASYELQRAIYAALIADPAVSALVGDRVYDRVPADVVFPYISFGPEQELPENADCIDASEIFVQLDFWSQDPGKREAKRGAKAIKAALEESALHLSENALTYFEFDGRRIMTDPDGLTSHAAVTFRAGVENL